MFALAVHPEILFILAILTLLALLGIDSLLDDLSNLNILHLVRPRSLHPCLPAGGSSACMNMQGTPPAQEHWSVQQPCSSTTDCYTCTQFDHVYHNRHRAHGIHLV